MAKQATVGAPLTHGAARLSAVEVTSYNVKTTKASSAIGPVKGHFGNSSTQFLKLVSTRPRD